MIMLGDLRNLWSLPGVPVYVSREHWEAFGEHRFYTAVEGCAPAHWPRDFHPTILHPVERAVGPWTASHPLAKDGKSLGLIHRVMYQVISPWWFTKTTIMMSRNKSYTF